MFSRVTEIRCINYPRFFSSGTAPGQEDSNSVSSQEQASKIEFLMLAMFSLYIYNNFVPVKQSMSKLPLLYHQQSLVLHVPTVLTNSRNHHHLSVSCCFSTLVNNADSSGVMTNTVKINNKRKKRKSVQELDEEKSFTVSYLVNSCGLSPEKALHISEKLCVKNPENPDSVLALFNKYGFTKSQIAGVVRKRPSVLASKEKTLMPKLEFFLSVGMSKDLLGNIICRDPTLLQTSLDNSIIPHYEFFKSIVLTDERAITTIRRNVWAFREDTEKHFIPNIKVLRELKVPESCIRYLLVHYAETLVLNTEEFKESISKVIEMGFDPLKSTFVMALHAVSGAANKLTWDQCYETYSKWGWSKEDIYMAFRKHPNCMLMSERKISQVLEFLIHKTGLDSKIIAKSPSVLFLSLEKRIIPRFSVIQLLSSRGLMRKQFSLNTILKPGEEYFLNKFVIPYEKEVPEIYNVYRGKIMAVEV